MNKKLLHFSSNYSNTLYVFLSAIALLLGGIIYIFLRTSEYVFFRWINAVGLANWLNSARNQSQYLNLYFPDWILFSLPDGLWAFAYSLIITGIWSGSRSVLKYFWMSSIPVLIIGFEVLQYTSFIKGTFCFQDIVFGMAGIITGIIIGIKLNKSKNYEN
jgi:hypothetical protein